MASDFALDVKMNGPLKIAAVNSDGHIDINREALKFIINEDGSRISKESRKYVIISVAGSLRKGKSFVLNFLLGYLRNKVSVTKIEQNNNLNVMSNFKTFEDLKSAEDTSSIKMWPEIFHIDGVSIMLMDTQCKIDMNNHMKETTELLKISSMLSMFQIFCFTDEIDEENMLQNIEKKLNVQIKNLQEKTYLPFSNEDNFNFQMMMVENRNPSEKNDLEELQLDYDQKFEEHYEDLFTKTGIYIKYFRDITETISNMFKKIGTQKIFNDLISLISHDISSDWERMLNIYSIEFNILKKEFTKIIDVVQKKKSRDQRVSELQNQSNQCAYNSWVEDPSSGAAASSANIHGTDDFHDSSRREKETKFQHVETSSSGQESHDSGLTDDEEYDMMKELKEYVIISDNGEDVLSIEEFMASQTSAIVTGLATNDVEMTSEENETDPNPSHNTTETNVESMHADLQTDTNTTIELTNYTEETINSGEELNEEILQIATEEAIHESIDNDSGLMEAAGMDDRQNLIENETFSENHMEVGENAEKWTHEIHRIISFPDSIEINTRFEFASVGFYWLRDNIARCTYCQSEQEIILGATSVHDRQRCPLFNQESTVENIRIIGIQQYMYCESHRILTFLSAGWPKQAAERYPVGCLELAKSGFFYRGPRDCARCAFCRLEVSGWENGDTAYGEHLRWNRSCPFLINLNVGNIPMGQEDLPQLVDTNIQNSSSQEISPIASSPKHVNYVDQRTRDCSYEMWPITMTQSRSTLSAAGFYYTGIGDRVVCFQCGGGLKDWAINDDPWVEHASWFPMCAYLLAKKGQNFVNAVQSKVTANRTKEENEKKERERQEFERAEREKRERAEQEPNERAVAEVPMTRLCKVCLDHELGIVFLPCGHMSSCAECAPRLFVCPICRAKPAAYIRAYLP